MSHRTPPGRGREPGLAAGLPYRYAAITTGRPLLVFTAGACPLDGAGTVVAPGDLSAQAEAAMANLGAALESAGARLEDVIKITVYVASNERSDLAAAWGVVHRRFGSHEPPATLLGVSVLGYPDQLFEVEAVAALPG
jgi:enamine deaminase RidA (YjgF/YER057c/UK114 family)